MVRLLLPRVGASLSGVTEVASVEVAAAMGVVPPRLAVSTVTRASPESVVDQAPA